MPFPYRLVPTPNITALAHDDLEVSLRCNFDFPLWKNVSFYVEWFADGHSIANDTSICENQNPEGDAPPCSQRHTEIGTRATDTFRAGHRVGYDNIFYCFNIVVSICLIFFFYTGL